MGSDSSDEDTEEDTDDDDDDDEVQIDGLTDFDEYEQNKREVEPQYRRAINWRV